MKSLDIQQHKIIQKCFKFYNDELFNSEIPEIFFVFDSSIKNAMGYFNQDKFKKQDDNKIPVISLNPNFFDDESIVILSTLLHEMCHAWQWLATEPPKTHGYHDAKWSFQMQKIGLMPSSTGKEGGKKTGRKMNDYVIVGGLFENVSKRFLSENENIFLFQGNKQLSDRKKSEQKKNKIKYTCLCKKNVWGKPELSIICGECKKHFESYE